MDREFYKALLETAENAGIKILTDDYCCQLLSWLYHFGGGVEGVVINFKLSEDIQMAQKRMNLYGGEIPKSELYSTLRKYLKEVEEIDKKDAHVVYPEWVHNICKRYGISTNVLR